jgi:hypothetical protein
MSGIIDDQRQCVVFIEACWLNPKKNHVYKTAKKRIHCITDKLLSRGLKNFQNSISKYSYIYPNE